MNRDRRKISRQGAKTPRALSRILNIQNSDFATLASWRLGERSSPIYFFLSNCIIQFGAHVLPPSYDEDCSQRADVGVICDQLRRQRTVLPFGSV